MRIEQTVYNLNGHELILRNAEEREAEMLLEYLRTTCAETRFLVKEPEEITLTLEEEKEFINAQNASDCNLMLIGLLDGEYVGNCSLMGMTLSRYRYRADMAIALFQKYTGLGIGKIMIEKLFSIAQEHGIEQVELEVMANNDRAIALYKKMGFAICGTFPNNMKYKDGTYADAYWMVRQFQA